MKVKTEQLGAIIVVKPQGALVGQDAVEFTSATMDLLEAQLGRIVVDTSHVPYLDSLGLEGLVDLAEHLARSSASLKLCAVSETLIQVFKLTGLISQFDLYEDAQAAVRSFC